MSERIQSEKRILHMARFDNLTNLPNRSWFKEVVSMKLASAQPHQRMALAVLDIDDFKHVNDSMGHVNGDKLLSAIANRLRSLSRQNMSFPALAVMNSSCLFRMSLTLKISTQRWIP